MDYKYKLELTEKQAQIIDYVLERIIEDWEFHFDTDSEHDTTKHFDDLYGQVQKVLKQIEGVI